MTTLAPPPDFRHVTLVACSPSRFGDAFALRAPGLPIPRLCSAASCMAAFVAFESITHPPAWMAVSTIAFAGVVGLLALRQGPHSAAGLPDGARRPNTISIVPWGVIVEDGGGTRVLRWNAIT